MKKVILVSLIAVVALFAADARLKESDNYYKNRHKDYKGYTNKVYALCKEVLDENPNNPQALWRLSRLYSLYGDNKTAKSEKISRYETARDYAEKAKANGVTIAESYFWYGVALGRIAQTKGILKSIALAGPIKQAFEKACSLNSNFVPAYDGLGAWYTEAPGFAGGDLNKAAEYLKKGLSKDPNYSLLYVDLAKVYIKQKKFADARALLDKCIAISKPTNPADFYLEDKPKAKELLAEIKNK